MTDAERTAQARHAEEAFTADAELLATDPLAVQHALADHHRGPCGRCAACGTVSRWPCAIAHRAANIARPGPGPLSPDAT